MKEIPDLNQKNSEIYTQFKSLQKYPPIQLLYFEAIQGWSIVATESKCLYERNYKYMIPLFQDFLKIQILELYKEIK